MCKSEYPAIEEVLEKGKRSLPAVKAAVREALKSDTSFDRKKPKNKSERFIEEYKRVYSEAHGTRSLTVNEITDWVMKDLESGKWD